MARMARLVARGIPRHVTRRGARRREDFLVPGAAGLGVEMGS